MNFLDKPGGKSSTKESLKLAAISMAVLTLVGCGGGGGESVVDTAQGAATKVSEIDLSATQKIQATKEDGVPDAPEAVIPELSAKELARRDELEKSLMAIELESGSLSKTVAKAAEISIVDKAAEDYKSALQKGFDSVATYSVGYLTEDVGPAGEDIKKRAKTVTKSLSLTTDVSKSDFVMPDMLYVRAGQLKSADVTKSAVFKQAVAQGKAILVEREPLGRAQYENLLYNVFSFAPQDSNAVLVKPTGDSNESWLAYAIDAETKTEYNEDGTPKEIKNQNTAAAGENYSINMETVASVLKGYELKTKALASGQPLVAIGETPEASKAVKTKVWGRYITGTAINGRDQGGPRYVGHTYIVNPHNWQWEERSDICSSKVTCGSYNNSYASYNVWGADMVNVSWWSEPTHCGHDTVIDNSVICGSDWTWKRVTTKGTKQNVGVEVGVSVTAEGEVGVPFVAKAKVSTTVSTSASYGKEWSESDSTEYTESMNVRFKKGYSARIGRGNYQANVSQWLRGRHERNSPIVHTTNWDGCVYKGGSYYGDPPTAGFGTYDCPSKWDGNHSQKIGQSKFRSFGDRVTVICKRIDAKCMNVLRNQYTNETMEKSFPL